MVEGLTKGKQTIPQELNKAGQLKYVKQKIFNSIYCEVHSQAIRQLLNGF